jgi:hypothetical protein
MISVLALIYSLQGINNKANTGSLHYYIFINLLLIQTLENGIKYYQTNKQTNAFVLALFLFMCKHIHHILQISHFWFFSPFICSSNWADDSSVFVVTCQLKSRTILESCIGWIWTLPIGTKINIDCNPVIGLVNVFIFNVMSILLLFWQ